MEVQNVHGERREPLVHTPPQLGRFGSGRQGMVSMVSVVSVPLSLSRARVV